jgi:hypothetical protein
MLLMLLILRGCCLNGIALATCALLLHSHVRTSQAYHNRHVMPHGLVTVVYSSACDQIVSNALSKVTVM